MLKCIEKKSGQVMAVKIMRNDDEEKLIAAQNEFEIQKNLKHPGIIEAKYYFLDHIRNTSYTVMELIDGKQIDEYVYSHGPCNGNLESLSKLFLEIIAKEIIRQILDGVKYIHEQGVCHRDIKPDNIMLLKEKESSEN